MTKRMSNSRKIKVMLPGDARPRLTLLNEQVKFDLYRKEEEIKQLSRVLHELSVESGDDRRRWLKDNEDLMVDLAEEFVDESLNKLDGAELDGETLELSLHVMTELRKTLGLFQTVIAGDQELEA